MGVFSVDAQLNGPAGTWSDCFLVDTGATFTVAPKSRLHKMGIEPKDRIRVEFANGQEAELDRGFAELKVQGFAPIMTPVLFGPTESEFILGAVTLETLCVTVDPVLKKLIKTKAILK